MSKNEQISVKKIRNFDDFVAHEALYGRAETLQAAVRSTVPFANARAWVRQLSSCCARTPKLQSEI